MFSRFSHLQVYIYIITVDRTVNAMFARFRVRVELPLRGEYFLCVVYIGSSSDLADKSTRRRCFRVFFKRLRYIFFPSNENPRALPRFIIRTQKKPGRPALDRATLHILRRFTRLTATSAVAHKFDGIKRAYYTRRRNYICMYT